MNKFIALTLAAALLLLFQNCGYQAATSGELSQAQLGGGDGYPGDLPPPDAIFTYHGSCGGLAGTAHSRIVRRDRSYYLTLSNCEILTNEVPLNIGSINELGADAVLGWNGWLFDRDPSSSRSRLACRHRSDAYVQFYIQRPLANLNLSANFLLVANGQSTPVENLGVEERDLSKTRPDLPLIPLGARFFEGLLPDNIGFFRIYWEPTSRAAALEFTDPIQGGTRLLTEGVECWEQ